MIVFKFFCDKKDLFTRKVTEKAIDEVSMLMFLGVFMGIAPLEAEDSV